MPDRQRVDEITRRLFRLPEPKAAEQKTPVKTKAPENSALLDIIKRFRRRTRD